LATPEALTGVLPIELAGESQRFVLEGGNRSAPPGRAFAGLLGLMLHHQPMPLPGELPEHLLASLGALLGVKGVEQRVELAVAARRHREDWTSNGPEIWLAQTALGTDTLQTVGASR